MSEGYTIKELGLLMQGNIAKIDELIKGNHEQHCDMVATLKEHNGRLRKTEEWKEQAKGGIKVAGFLVGVMFTVTLAFTGWYIYYTQNLLGKTVEAQTSIKVIEERVNSIQTTVNATNKLLK